MEKLIDDSFILARQQEKIDTTLSLSIPLERRYDERENARQNIIRNELLAERNKSNLKICNFGSQKVINYNSEVAKHNVLKEEAHAAVKKIEEEAREMTEDEHALFNKALNAYDIEETNYDKLCKEIYAFMKKEHTDFEEMLNKTKKQKNYYHWNP